ncbi:MAG: fatty acyl-AMP ligase, partial [Crocosphaera sp.]
LLYPPGLDFIIAFFACLYAGVIAIPLYPPRPNRSINRIKAIIANAEVKIGLSTSEAFPKIERRFLDNPELSVLSWLKSDNLPETSQNFQLSCDINPKKLALLQYTSGSTGQPKGVMVSHGNILHNCQYIQQSFELTSEDVSATWLPHFHDMGLIDGILEPIYSGILGVLMPPIAFLGRPINWLKAISDYGVTHSGGPNFAYDLCVNKISLDNRKTLDLSGWKTAYNGAEPIRAQTLEQFTKAFEISGFQAKYFYPCYGLAESTLMVTGGYREKSPTQCQLDTEALGQNKVKEATEKTLKSKQFVSCGYPWLNTQIVIVNPQSLTPCLADEVGEIWVSSNSVAQGYWNLPEVTQQTFNAYLAAHKEIPFFRTGDLGFIKDGELFITGRLKDILIIKGENYYPQDIEETVAHSNKALRQNCTAAFSVSIDGVEKLIIVQEVERTYRKKLDFEKVVGDICQAVMREYDLLIYDLVLIKPGSIPKTSSGKIQRKSCQKQYLENTLDKLTETITNPALGKNRI